MCVCVCVSVCVREAVSGVHGVEREDQSRGRMSLTLLTAHTDGAVRTQNPPIQNTHTHSAHTYTQTHTQGRCMLGHV